MVRERERERWGMENILKDFQVEGGGKKAAEFLNSHSFNAGTLRYFKLIGHMGKV